MLRQSALLAVSMYAVIAGAGVGSGNSIASDQKDQPATGAIKLSARAGTDPGSACRDALAQQWKGKMLQEVVSSWGKPTDVKCKRGIPRTAVYRVPEFQTPVELPRLGGDPMDDALHAIGEGKNPDDFRKDPSWWLNSHFGESPPRTRGPAPPGEKVPRALLFFADDQGVIYKCKCRMGRLPVAR